jgi:hypothetical protein
MKKIYTSRGPKGKNWPLEPKNGILVPKLVWSCDISIDQEFNIDELIEPKNGIWGPKSVWSCDISIDREFYMEHEKIYFWGSKRQK